VLPELHPVDEHDAFRDAMSAVASGVVLVTCSVDGREWATTVTSFMSVSADPPTVLVSLHSDSTAARAIAATGRYGIVVLAEQHVGLARAASVPGAPKFVHPNQHASALAELDCDVLETLVVEDHVLFIARARAVHDGDGVGHPLIYHRRRYQWPSS
jgi:flavin reductase (DIM6/NTAB) family NADH-FMN oxidoreductase RutF